MKTKIFMIEVGVELEPHVKDYGFYNVKLNGIERELFDENTIAFLDKQKALEFIDDYIEKGVKNTYGVLWEIERVIENYEMDELINLGYLEDEYLSRERNNVIFKGGKQ